MKKAVTVCPTPGQNWQISSVWTAVLFPVSCAGCAMRGSLIFPVQRSTCWTQRFCMVGTDSTSKSIKKIVCRIFLFDRQLLFNLLVYDYRTHSSNIPSGRRSESNPHSPVGHCRYGSPVPSAAPWSHPVHPQPRHNGQNLTGCSTISLWSMHSLCWVGRLSTTCHLAVTMEEWKID